MLSSRLLLPTKINPLKWVEFVALARSAGIFLTNPPLGLPLGIADEIERQSRLVIGAWGNCPLLETLFTLDPG